MTTPGAKPLKVKGDDDSMDAQRRGPSRRTAAEPFFGDDEDEDLSRRDVHGSRDQEYPSDEPVHEDDDGDWSPPSMLQAPPARPGYVQRWIRVRRGNQDDVQNLMSRRGEGWQPRDPKTVPDHFQVPTLAHGTFGSCIMVEGMVLCEMTKRRSEQRKAFYAGKLDRQTVGVERQLLQQQQPGHPIDHKVQTAVTVGKPVGKRPNVREDDAA